MVKFNDGPYVSGTRSTVTPGTLGRQACTVGVTTLALAIFHRRHAYIVSSLVTWLGHYLSGNVASLLCHLISGLCALNLLASLIGLLLDGIGYIRQHGKALRAKSAPKKVPPVKDKLTLTAPTMVTPSPLAAQQSASPWSGRRYTASPYSVSAPATSPTSMGRLRRELDSALEVTSDAPSPGYVGPSPADADRIPALPGGPLPPDAGDSSPFLSPPALYRVLGEGDEPQHTLPRYHFSLQWSGATAETSTGTLTPSLPRAVDNLLLSFDIDRHVLRVWAERLRYWVAAEVTQPFMRRMHSVPSTATAVLSAIGNPAQVAVPPLLPASGRWEDLSLPGDDALLRAIDAMQQLAARAAQSQPATGGTMFSLQQPTTAAQTNASTQQRLSIAVTAGVRPQALQRYRHLCRVLRGDSPNPGVLGNCPPGYLASRVAALAADSCCKAFRWDGGGTWHKSRWSRELPTDTAVLLYLLSAYLNAPQWHAEEQDRLPLGPGGPLIVGAVPGRVRTTYLGILTSKPGKDVMRHMAAGLVLMPGAAAEPLLLLVLKGKPTVTLTGEWATFEKVVLWLAYIDRHLEGRVGHYSLDYLKLDSVLDVVPPDTSGSQRRWFGIFA